MSKFANLTITGDVSVQPVTTKVPEHSLRYLLLGPTGSGKSSLIETLGGKSPSLSISKDQLSGYTQHITPYRLVNAKNLIYPIYLIDTPGFSDTKISELEIMDMVRKWLRHHELSYVDVILFLTPITVTRLSGSKRRTVEMLKDFIKSQELASIVFVTTMWDKLHNTKAQQRAESNFAQLRDDILMELINNQAELTKFDNTQHSALQILDRKFYGAHAFSGPVSGVSIHLYQDLHERIEGALQMKKSIEADLAQPEAQGNAELKSILERNHRDNEETLTKFIEQFLQLGNPPPGFEAAYRYLQETIAETNIPRSMPVRLLVLKVIVRNWLYIAKNQGTRWLSLGC